MFLKRIALGCSIAIAAATSNAMVISFDNAEKGAGSIIATGTGTGTNGSDVWGSSLGFDGFSINAGYSTNLNLAGPKFNKANDITTANFDVYQDIKPAHGGLGAMAPGGSGDNLNSNILNNYKSDEVLFFDFLTSVRLNTVWFNGEHKELTTASNDETRNDAEYNIFGSKDGVNYTTLINGQRQPTDRDFLSLNARSYQYFAVAATGYGQHKGYVEAIDYVEVPEPGTLALLGLGLAGLGFARRLGK